MTTQGRTAKETKIFSVAVQVVLLHIIFNIAIIVSIKVLQRDDSEKFTMLKIMKSGIFSESSVLASPSRVSNFM